VRGKERGGGRKREGERERAFNTPRYNYSITDEADFFHSHNWTIYN
jgi:hypothetical protein